MEFTSNEREGVHPHTLVDREQKRCKNADEGVVLVAIQIAVDSDLSANHGASAFNTRAAR